MPPSARTPAPESRAGASAAAPAECRRSRRERACRRAPARNGRSRLPIAPVNAPRSYPNSSLSRSVAGSAAALTRTKVPPSARSRSWIRAREQLFAGPGLAEEQNRRIGSAQPLDSLQHPLQRRAAADDVPEVVFDANLLFEVQLLLGELVLQRLQLFMSSRTFTGELSHVADYRSPTPYAGQRVVVVGAGDSAAQVANELARVATTLIATRHPSGSSPSASVAMTSITGSARPASTPCRRRGWA